MTNDLIQQEIENLQAVFADIPAGQKAIANNLIDRAAFMTVTLRRLEESLNSSELVEVYQHGEAQTGVKQAAELQGYNALVKNYATVMRQLYAMIPKTAEKKAGGNQLMEILAAKQAGTKK